MSLPFLTGERARSWRSGVPTYVFVLGPPLSFLTYVVLTWDSDVGYLSTIDELVSLSAALWILVDGATVLGCCLGAVAPRLAGWSVVLGAGTTALFQGGGTVELGVAGVWVLVLTTDAVLRARQRREAPRGATHLPAGLLPRLAPWHAVAVVALVAVIGLVAFVWADRRADFIALGERAERTTGTVVSFEEDTVQVEVDGTTHDFWDPSFYLRVEGDEVPVMVDPAGIERPFGLEDADPDGWSDILLVPGAALMGLFLILVAGPRRVRAARRLLAGADAVRARVDVDASDRLVLLAAEDDVVVAVLGGLRRVRPPGTPSAARPRGWAWLSVELVDWLLAEEDWVAPEELWALQEWDDEDASRSQPRPSPADVVVSGLRRYGDPVVVTADVDGAPLVVAALRVVHPSTVRRGWSAALAAGPPWDRWPGAGAATPLAGSEHAGERGDDTPISARVVQAIRSARPWFLGLLAAAAGAAGWFFWDQSVPDAAPPSWAIVVLGAVLVGGLGEMAWSFLAPAYRISGEDLVVPHDLVDRVIDLRAVIGVRVRPGYVAVDLDGQRHSEAIHPRAAAGSRLARRQLEDAAQEIRAAAGLVTGRPTGPPVRGRLGEAVLVGVLVAVPYLVLSIVVTGGQMPLLDLAWFDA